MQFESISQKTSRQIAISVTLLFLAFALFGQFVLPDRFSGDTTNMVDIAENIVSGADASFLVIANLIRVFTLPGLTALVIFSGCCIILYLLKDRRFASTLLIALYSIALATPLSLVRPQKEILVFLLTAVCLLIVMRAKTPGRALFGSLLAYGLYLYISRRPYYILITAIIPVLFLFEKLSARARVAILLLIGVAGFLIPSFAFELLRLTRDAANDLRVLYPEMEGNRSAFSNPFEAATWPAFLGNYVYAVVRLNFPVLFSRTPSEFALTLFSILWFYVLWMTYKIGDWRARFTARLIISHLLIMMIFEPDLGSYLRHFSSCLLYLQPILLQLDRLGLERRALFSRAPAGVSVTAAPI